MPLGQAAASATTIETVVIEQMRRILRSPEVLAQAVRHVTDLHPGISEQDAIGALQSIDAVWEHLFAPEQARIAQTLIERITVRRDGISIAWKTTGLPKLLRDTIPMSKHSTDS